MYFGDYLSKKKNNSDGKFSQEQKSWKSITNDVAFELFESVAAVVLFTQFRSHGTEEVTFLSINQAYI